MEIISGIGIIDNALTNEYCDELIKYFYKRLDLWEEGRTISEYNTDKKDTIHIRLGDTEHASTIEKIFHELVIKYLQKMGEGIDWNYRSLFAKGIKYTGLKLQRYVKNEGHYNAVHQERDSTRVFKRMFVVMAYLNTICVGGKTKFPYFKISVSPIAGKVVIWPAGMPYLHQGTIPNDDHKFIITAWLEQVDD